MASANTPRDCPLCRHRRVPPWFVACGPCWKSLPPHLSRSIASGWRHRVIEPARWEEALAEVLLWGRDQRADAVLLEKGGVPDHADEQGFAAGYLGRPLVPLLPR